jgi:hypothetical protein
MNAAPLLSGRIRFGLGLAFVALAMAAAAALAGHGFAGTSPSAAQYQYGKTVAICHHTNSKKHPWVDQRINIRAWPAHIQHGDTFGACTQAQLHPKPMKNCDKKSKSSSGNGQGNASPGDKGKGHNK